MRVCVRACMHACVRSWMRVCVHICVIACMLASDQAYPSEAALARMHEGLGACLCESVSACVDAEVRW